MNFFKKADSLPLFILQAVLFPDGQLPLRFLEQHSMETFRNSLQKNRRFGLCLNAAGHNEIQTVDPHLIGTEAIIQTFEKDEKGMISVMIRGGRRFRIHDYKTDKKGQINGTISWLNESVTPVPAAQAELLPLLTAMVNEPSRLVPKPYRFNDAAWVGARYAELLPIPLLAKQRLLELDDVISRLEIIQQFLWQHGLLGKAK